MSFYLSALVLATLSLSFVITSCTTKPTREIAAVNSGPNPERVRYLHQAAENGVLFLNADSVLRDVPTQQVGACRKAENPIWAENLFSLLEGLDQNQRLYGKIHVIELKRGDSAKVVWPISWIGASRFHGSDPPDFIDRSHLISRK